MLVRGQVGQLGGNLLGCHPLDDGTGSCTLDPLHSCIDLGPLLGRHRVQDLFPGLGRHGVEEGAGCPVLHRGLGHLLGGSLANSLLRWRSFWSGLWRRRCGLGHLPGSSPGDLGSCVQFIEACLVGLVAFAFLLATGIDGLGELLSVHCGATRNTESAGLLAQVHQGARLLGLGNFGTRFCSTNLLDATSWPGRQDPLALAILPVDVGQPSPLDDGALGDRLVLVGALDLVARGQSVRVRTALADGVGSVLVDVSQTLVAVTQPAGEVVGVSALHLGIGPVEVGPVL